MRPMRAAHRFTGFAALFVLTAACGSSPPPQATTPAPPPAPTATTAAAADLSPVAEPKTLIGVGRWKNAASTIQSIEQLVKAPLPLPLEEVLTREVIQKSLRDRELAKLVKLDGSVDVAITLDPASREDKPEVFVAVSVPLKSFEEAQAVINRGAAAAPARPGLIRLGRQPSDIYCDVAMSVGAAPARLVCSEKEADLDALVPWLTRGAPSADFGPSDFHFEARFAPLRDRYRGLIDQFGPRLPALASSEFGTKLGVRDPIVLDAVSDAVREAVQAGEEIDMITFDAALDGQQGIGTAKGSLKFNGNKAWPVRALTGRNSKAAAPPEMFWLLPKDADAAGYSLAPDAALLEGPRKTVSELVASLTRSVLADKDRKAIADLILRMPLAAGATVSASGRLAKSDVAPAPKDDLKPADVVKITREKFADSVGWVLIGTESKADPFTAWARDLPKTYNSASLQRSLKELLTKNGVKKTSFLPKVKSVATPRGLPAGTTAIELAVDFDSQDVWSNYSRITNYKEHPKGAPAKGTLAVTLAVIPDGDRAWIGISADPALLVSHFNATKGAKDGTLAAREGLDQLRSSKTVSGGFLSLGGLTKAATSSVSGMLRPERAASVQKMFSSLPNKGMTPVLFMANGDAGDKPTFVGEFIMQKGSFDDLQAVISTMPAVIESAELPIEQTPTIK